MLALERMMNMRHVIDNLKNHKNDSWSKKKQQRTKLAEKKNRRKKNIERKRKSKQKKPIALKTKRQG